jgi:methionyl-tRNA formyltransferase
MRIIYMGTPEFAVPGLKVLVENGYNVVGVITAPDKPQGRGLKLGITPVKEYALTQNLKVLQPEKLKDPTFLEELKSLHADLQIVVAFRMLPETVWNMPPKGTFNLHASLLPQYRGAAPINWVIINGEKETGVTTFFLKHEIDTGDIILQEKEPISDSDNVGTVYERLMNRGAGLILKTVQQIEIGKVNQQPQVFESELKTAPKIFKENCEIDWSKSHVEIRDFVRGLSPYPAAFTKINGLNCKIFDVNLVDKKLNKQEFVTDSKTYFYIGTGKGSLSIETLQMEGKKRMGIKEFLMGNKINTL